MIKEIKYMSVSIWRSISHDSGSVWKSMDKPKQVMEMLFWVVIIQFFTGNYPLIPITIILFVIAYCWKVIRRGEWKNIMRQDNYHPK